MTWEAWTAGQACAIRTSGRWRAPRDLDTFGVEGVDVSDGRTVVSFASNDYLGLTHHPAVRAAAHAASATDVWVLYPLDPLPTRWWVYPAWIALALAGVVVQMSTTTKLGGAKSTAKPKKKD